MPSCSVLNCSSTDKNEYSFFKLPKKRSIRQKWIEVCNTTANGFNVKCARICSLHFRKSDYIPNVDMKHSTDPFLKLKLKPEAIPTCHVRNTYHEASKLGDKLQKREIRRYLLDTQRRNLIKCEGFEKFEVYVNTLLCDSLVYNRPRRVSTQPQFVQSANARQVKHLNALVKKLIKKVSVLQNSCKYWSEVARLRGKMVIKLKSQRRKLGFELSQLRNQSTNN